MHEYTTKGELIKVALEHILEEGSAIDSALPQAAASELIHEIHEMNKLSLAPVDPRTNYLFHFGWLYTPSCSFGRLYPLTNQGFRLMLAIGEKIGHKLDDDWTEVAEDVYDKLEEAKCKRYTRKDSDQPTCSAEPEAGPKA